MEFGRRNLRHAECGDQFRDTVLTLRYLELRALERVAARFEDARTATHRETGQFVRGSAVVLLPAAFTTTVIAREMDEAVSVVATPLDQRLDRFLGDTTGIARMSRNPARGRACQRCRGNPGRGGETAPAVRAPRTSVRS